MYTKLFERLVTKFSIRVTDLIKYLEISKATIYNYRNLEKFSDIPKDKQLKIFYLFGKESEQELELVLDEADPDMLAGYLSRISSILKGSYNNKLQTLNLYLVKCRQHHGSAFGWTIPTKHHSRQQKTF